MPKLKLRLPESPPAETYRARDTVWWKRPGAKRFIDGSGYIETAAWVISVNTVNNTVLIGFFEPQGTRNERVEIVSPRVLRHREI